MDEGLEALRAEMETINGDLLDLLSRRGRLAQRIGELKDRLGIGYFDPLRESQMLHRILEANPGPFDAATLAHLFKAVFRASADLMGPDHLSRCRSPLMSAPLPRPLRPMLPPLVLGSRVRPRLDRPVFIVSAPHSGSTLLFETLAANPGFHTLGGEASWLVESNPLLRPGALGVDSDRLTADHCTPKIAEGITHLAADRLVDAEGEQVDDAMTVRFLEKTPQNALRIPFFLKVFPQARFIFLWRDPRENLSCTMEARQGPGPLLLPPGWQAYSERPLEEIAAFQWEATNRTILDDLERLPTERWTAVNFEEFLANPLAETRRLWAFAEVPFDEASVGGLQQPQPSHSSTQTAPEPGKRLKHEQAILSVLPSLEPVWARLRALAGLTMTPRPSSSLPAESPGVVEVLAPPLPENRPMGPYALAGKDDVHCSVTNRLHVTDTSVRRFLEGQYGFMPLAHIKDTFGFVQEFTNLYGGRLYNPQRLLSHRDVAELYDLGIGVKLCLQNHFITQEDCVANREFLARYHRKGNVVICASDVLARFVREEFPDYVVEASIIKEVHDPEAIEACLEVFDLFTLPPSANDNLDFLASLPSKDRIILFGNARCLYTCKLRNCYRNNSVLTRRASEPDFGTLEAGCSPTAPRQFEYTLFDLERLYQMGFRRFKWIIPDAALHRREDLKPGTYSTKNGALLRPPTGAMQV